jgi:hypothetical protein
VAEEDQEKSVILLSSNEWMIINKGLKGLKKEAVDD